MLIAIVFLPLKRRRGTTIALKSFKSRAVTDRAIDENYYDYEQYERSWWNEAFCSLLSLRLLFAPKYLHEVMWKINVYIIKRCVQLKIYSLSVKKYDDIREVTNSNIIP